MTQKSHKERYTILFIDDESICHDVINLILGSTGKYEIISAYNGQEALALAKESADKIDLIFLDIMLPDMSGYEIYEHIRADKTLKNVPIIFQSGISSRDQNTQNILQQEGVYMLSKPYRNEELQKIIAKCLAVS